ncbi:MAG: NADH-quinone oxidoreductase subunit J [Spirochaetaceae bacterium]|nr:NADH-quinone oxidoreductase subunit J [Spirochaetaceae bacterium]|tara:strand:- start:449503 stop:449871 length:369 start_codon:yes stop_codon:yes gene_type:complete
MFEFFLGHFSYWLTIVLLCIGLYGMLFKRSMVKKVVGLTIFQSAIIIFWVSLATKPGATVPVKEASRAISDTSLYLNPLPHTLMLTAIVVGVATLGVAFSLLIAIWNRYRTLDEKELIQKVQ